MKQSAVKRAEKWKAHICKIKRDESSEFSFSICDQSIQGDELKEVQSTLEAINDVDEPIIQRQGCHHPQQHELIQNPENIVNQLQDNEDVVADQGKNNFSAFIQSG